jgi:hypothetical protein
MTFVQTHALTHSRSRFGKEGRVRQTHALTQKKSLSFFISFFTILIILKLIFTLKKLI